MDKNNYCVYFHVNPIKKEIFYVGIGNEKRPYQIISRSKFWHNIVNKYGYNIIIIKKNISWEEACKLEIYFIKFIGRRDQNKGTLVNMTDGGEGIPGHICSEETKRKIGNKNKVKSKGKHPSDETRRKMSESQKGKIFSKEHRNKLSIAQTGKKYSEEDKLKMSLAKLGKKHSEEHNRKIGESHKGLKYKL